MTLPITIWYVRVHATTSLRRSPSYSTAVIVVVGTDLTLAHFHKLARGHMTDVSTGA